MNDFLERKKLEIMRIKRELSSRVCIAAHHYQKEDIIDCADIVGDSYRLAVEVAQSEAEYIIFCGVLFMAEGAAVFSKEHQKVLMPDPAAGCPMADMITEAQAEAAIAQLQSQSGRNIIPVVYMNANTPLKAVCGKHGGAVCTSSNARVILQHYLSRDASVFFFPDQHLGLNTALQAGLGEDEVQKMGPNAFQKDPRVRLYLWDGYCPVHQEFTVSQIDELRKEYPGIQVIVHPEVCSSVARKADISGSTEQIFTTIRNAEKGSSWAVGTENHFVSRLAGESAGEGKTVVPLKSAVCEDMEKTTLDNLLELLYLVYEGNHDRIRERQVTVEKAHTADAQAALTRMVNITEGNSRK